MTSDIERWSAEMENLKGEFSKTTLVFFGLLNQMGEGPSILQRLREGAESWQVTLIHIAALVDGQPGRKPQYRDRRQPQGCM